MASLVSSPLDDKHLRDIMAQAGILDQWFDTVIDLGCGTGRYTHLLKHHTTTVIGIDRSKDALEIAARDHAGDGIRYQLDNIGHLTGDYPLADLVVMINVLHFCHINIWNTIARLLKPGGLLLVSEPGRYSRFGTITEEDKEIKIDAIDRMHRVLMTQPVLTRQTVQVLEGNRGYVALLRKRGG